MTRLKTAAIVLLTVGAIGVGTGVLIQSMPAAAQLKGKGVAPPPAGRDAAPSSQPGAPAHPAPLHRPILRAGSIVAVEPATNDRIWAYSNQKGSWRLFKAPKDTKLVAMVSGDVLAPVITGKGITQVAGFSGQTGTWTAQTLRTPTDGRLVPIVTGALAVYQIGQQIYAFSALTGTWGVLDLKSGTKAQPEIANDVILVDLGSTIHVFGAKAGRWDRLDMGAN